MSKITDTYLGLSGRRVENIGRNVSEWADRTHEPASTWDLCIIHADRLERNPHLYDDRLVSYGQKNEPSGDEGRGGDVEHPPYEAMDPEDRKCTICGVDLIDD